MLRRILCIAFILLALPLYANERITNFVSDIVVHQNSSMTVTETIRVVAEGNSIRHGIYRDFPTRYRDEKGNNVVVGFKVVSVARDGFLEKWRTENISNGKRVYIGDADTYLEPGIYTYTITYDTTRQLGFFPDHDELYWNVTGNGWEFPIESAQAVVTLPSGINKKDVKLTAYTGYQGTRGQDYTSGFDQRGRPYFATTRPLAPTEGFTVVVGWPKGFVTPPSTTDKAASFLIDNINLLILWGGFILVLIYYLNAWNKYGRDPIRGTIIPLYEPPDGLSPAAVRYIRRMNADNKAFAAAIIDMAVKGTIKIMELPRPFSIGKKKYAIERTNADESALAPEEAELYGILLDAGYFAFEDENYAKVKVATETFNRSLENRFQTKNFTTNAGLIVPGVLISILGIVFAAMTAHFPDMGIVQFATPWFAVLSLLAAYATYQAIANKTLAAYFFSPLLLAALLIASVAFTTISSAAFMLGVLVLSAINAVFYPLMPAYTREGRKLLDRIEGFAMYLSVAEGHELNAMHPPAMTPEIFERYLPYALALDVENRWSERFAKYLQTSDIRYQPIWYTGGYWDYHTSPSSFGSDLASSLPSAISSSATPPGSSSGGGGFGGGGSSGGGGGGGGGGGW